MKVRIPLFCRVIILQEITIDFSEQLQIPIVIIQIIMNHHIINFIFELGKQRKSKIISLIHPWSILEQKN